MSTVQDRANTQAPGQGRDEPAKVSELKFVPLDEEDAQSAGGWYRELPDEQIEVLSRAHLQRVPLDRADPEQKAKQTIAAILGRNAANTPSK